MDVMYRIAIVQSYCRTGHMVALTRIVNPNKHGSHYQRSNWEGDKVNSAHAKAHDLRLEYTLVRIKHISILASHVPVVCSDRGYNTGPFRTEYLMYQFT